MDIHVGWKVSLLSYAAIGQIFVSVLGVLLVVRAVRFYGSVREFFNNRLGGLSCCYFVSAFLLMNVMWIEVCHFTEWIIHSGINGILFTFNVCWFYITIIYRVYISFKNNNEYKLTRLELICLAFSALLQFDLLFLCSYKTPRVTRPSDAGIIFIIVLCIDIALNITILYVFLKRLYQMILDLDASFDTLIRKFNMHEADNVSPPLQLQLQLQSDLICNDEIEIRDKMEKIRMQESEVVNIMAKISLLTIVSEIFINIYFIMIASVYLDDALKNFDWTGTYQYWIMEQFAWITGVCINCFTLYATFVFNDDHYMKCCRCCHKRLKKCCVRCVTGQVFRYRR